MTEDRIVMHALQEASMMDLVTELTKRSEACLIVAATVAENNTLMMHHSVSGRPLLLGFLKSTLEDQIYKALGGVNDKRP